MTEEKEILSNSTDKKGVQDNLLNANISDKRDSNKNSSDQKVYIDSQGKNVSIQGSSGNRVGQEQLYDLLVSRELSWQAIIFDLIRTEQLNPWDIDLVILAQKYVEKIRELQELGEGAFFISSKVLLAAAILLRIKSEILRESIGDLDDILFAKKKLRIEIVNPSQLITIDEDEIPILVPRTPLPRARKLTLPELMNALEKAINTEQRRIKKTLSSSKLRREIGFAVFPRFTFNLTTRIREIFAKIKNLFSSKKTQKITFSDIVMSQDKNERIPVFLSLIHLDHQRKIWLEQQAPFADLDVYLKRQGSSNPEDISLDSLNQEIGTDIEDQESVVGGEVEEIKDI